MQELESSPRGYPNPSDAGIELSTKRKGKMPLQQSKSTVDRRSRRSEGTIASARAFTPAVDPSTVGRRQVEAPEWHASLDQNRRSQTMRATESAAPVLGAIDAVTNPTAIGGGGDNVAGSSEPASKTNDSVVEVSAELSGKLPTSEGGGGDDIAATGASDGGGVNVGTAKVVERTDAAAVASAASGNGGDEHGSAKNATLGRKVVTS
jgi:hypothetical protein